MSRRIVPAAVSPAAREKRLAYFAWVAVCVIWGTTYLAIRVTLETMPPLLMSGIRWTLAGAVLSGYLALRGERFPDRSSWGSIALLGFLLLFVGNGAVAWAEQWVPSGLTAVIVASSPFWMAGTEALRSDGERISVRLALGLALGFAGIVLLVWPDITSLADMAADSWPESFRSSSRASAGRSDRPIRGAMRARPTSSARPPRR